MKKILKTLLFSFFMVLGLFLVASCDEPTKNPTEPTSSHTHEVKEDKWLRDSATHWKECSGCDEYLEMGLHEYGDWIQSTIECKKTRECTVCGFAQTQKDQHNFVDGKCTICNKNEGDIEVVQYYVRGTLNDWGATDEYALVLNEEDFTATITVHLAKDDQFKVADASWTDGYNFGYGNPSVEFDEALFGNDDGDNIKVLVEADYIITVSGLDTDVHTVKIVASCLHEFGEPVLVAENKCDYVSTCSKCNIEVKSIKHFFEDNDTVCDRCGANVFEHYYIKGNFNGFAANEDFKLEYDEATNSATIDLLLTPGHAFKIGTAEGWQFSFDSTVIPAGAFVADADNNFKAVATTKTGEDVLFTVTITGLNTINHTLSITTEDEYVVEGEEPDNNGGSSETVTFLELYLIGNMTNWTANDSYKLEALTNSLELEVNLYLGNEFKIATSNWATEINFNGVSCDEEYFQAGTDEKPNIIVKKDGAYKIVVTKAGENLACVITFVSDIKCTSENGQHTFVDATCTTPKTCSTCEYKIGAVLGHLWDEGKTEGTKIVYTCTRTGCEETKEVETDQSQLTTLYLKPNSNWKADNARFAAYFFNATANVWVDLTDTNSDGVYEVIVPEGYTNVIFCRMSPSSTENNWNNKWNQTGDLTVPTDGNVYYQVPDGTWDGSTDTGWAEQ